MDCMGTKATPVNASSGTRACLAVSGSVLAFALLIECAGLLPAVVATALVAALGTRTSRLRETFIFAVCLAAVVALLFVGLLGQPITLLVGL
jgi:hypothetical protein